MASSKKSGTSSGKTTERLKKFRESAAQSGKKRIEIHLGEAAQAELQRRKSEGQITAGEVIESMLLQPSGDVQSEQIVEVEKLVEVEKIVYVDKIVEVEKIIEKIVKQNTASSSETDAIIETSREVVNMFLNYQRNGEKSNIPFVRLKEELQKLSYLF
jgi:hypothetical protein